jgi:hypothetical protein
MKSLIKSAQVPKQIEAEQTAKPTPSIRAEQAQCCAKVSKTVAGCHD